jgi:hypothetical protein
MRQSNKILHEAFDMLFRERVVRSHNRFSTDFLNKSPRYMSWLSANNNKHEPSIEACVALYVSLTELGSKLSVSSASNIAEDIDDLTDRLWGEIIKSVKKQAWA